MLWYGCGILFLQHAESYSIPLLLFILELLSLEKLTPPSLPISHPCPFPPPFLEGAIIRRDISPGGRQLYKPVSHNHNLDEPGTEDSFMLQPVWQPLLSNVLVSVRREKYFRQPSSVTTFTESQETS